jgi:hypothetical protein
VDTAVQKGLRYKDWGKVIMWKLRGKRREHEYTALKYRVCGVFFNRNTRLCLVKLYETQIH